MIGALLHAYQLMCCVLNPWVIRIKRTFHLMFSLPSLSLAQSAFLQVGPYFWNVFVSPSFLNPHSIAPPVAVLPASFWSPVYLDELSPTWFDVWRYVWSHVLYAQWISFLCGMIFICFLCPVPFLGVFTWAPCKVILIDDFLNEVSFFLKTHLLGINSYGGSGTILD